MDICSKFQRNIDIGADLERYLVQYILQNSSKLIFEFE